MRNAFLIVLIIMMCSSASAYNLSETVDGIPIRWTPQEITITIDPSVDVIRDDAVQIIETAFLEWLDYIDVEITINFVTSECDDETRNCIRYNENDYVPGSTIVEWYDSGEMASCNITFNSRMRPYDMERVALHEAGHFWGIDHSDNHDAIMYRFVTAHDELHADDIAGIKTAYDQNGVVYPAPKIEDIEYHLTGCSVSRTVGTASSIFNLIF